MLVPGLAALFAASLVGPAVADITATEPAPGNWYPVWSAALDHGLPEGVTEVVVLTRTVAAPWSVIDDVIDDATDPQSGRETHLVDRFARVEDGRPVRSAHRITRRFDALANIVLLTPKTLDVLFAPGPEAGWETLAKRFPDSPGLIGLSDVRFTEDGESAQVYVSFGCGVDCGAGRVITLGRDADAGWMPRTAELLWVAAGEPRAPARAATAAPDGSGDGTQPEAPDNILGYPLEPDSAR